MNPSDWIYRLNLSTMLDRNGFLDPCSRVEPQRRRTDRVPRAARIAIAGAAVLVPLALAAAVALRSWA